MQLFIINSEDGAAGGTFNVLDIFAWQLVTLSIDSGILVEFLRVLSGAVVQQFEFGTVELACIETPEDVLEVEGAVAIVDQHHGGQLVISEEVLEGVPSDPFERLRGELGAVEAKEAECTL